MKRIAAFISALAVILLAAVSCVKDESPIAIGVEEMGALRGSTFTTDAGMVFNITKISADPAPGDLERMLGTFDIVSKVSEKEFDVVLTSFVVPLVKDAVRTSEIEDDSLYGHDPAQINNGWLSGGYLNLKILVNYKKGSETKHLMNLEYLDKEETVDTLRFILRHNGYGEGSSYGQDGYSLGTSWVSFRVADLIPSGMDSIPIKIESSWFEVDADNRPTGHLQTFYNTGTLKRNR